MSEVLLFLIPILLLPCHLQMSAEGSVGLGASPTTWGDGYQTSVEADNEEPDFPASLLDPPSSTPPSAFWRKAISFRFDERYAFSDADIVVVASFDFDRLWEEPEIRFKAHKRKLRAASVIFNDMLDCGNNVLKEGDELPEVHLAASVQTIAVLLGAVYCDQRDKDCSARIPGLEDCKRSMGGRKEVRATHVSCLRRRYSGVGCTTHADSYS